eukprot:scaffold6748_cov122-Isochrysis_galbana.AAC.9
MGEEGQVGAGCIPGREGVLVEERIGGGGCGSGATQRSRARKYRAACTRSPTPQLPPLPKQSSSPRRVCVSPQDRGGPAFWARTASAPYHLHLSLGVERCLHRLGRDGLAPATARPRLALSAAGACSHRSTRFSHRWAAPNAPAAFPGAGAGAARHPAFSSATHGVAPTSNWRRTAACLPTGGGSCSLGCLSLRHGSREKGVQGAAANGPGHRHRRGHHRRLRRWRKGLGGGRGRRSRSRLHAVHQLRAERLVYARGGGQTAGQLLVGLLARQPGVGVDTRARKSATARKLLFVKQLDQTLHLSPILIQFDPRALGRSLQLAPQRLQHRQVGTQPVAALLLAQVGGQVVACPH